MGLKVGLLVVCLLMAAAVPATAQLADPLSLAASGVLLPFFNNVADGFVSVLEITSPVVPTTIGTVLPLFDLTNPIHAIFFNATCVRGPSVSDVFTAKQAKAYIISPGLFTPPFTLNGLVAIGSSIEGNDLVPLHFPIHSRVHWIDTKTGRLRELEPIILDQFNSLDEGFLPLILSGGAGASIGECASGPATGTVGPFNNGHCWSPLRSAAAFVTPQESASIKASLILICPRSSIQSSGGGGVFPTTINGLPAFPRLVNRDGSFGFPSGSVITGNSVSALRGRIYNDNEHLERDVQLGCDCLTRVDVTAIDGVYNLAPFNLGPHTVPVWYTELEVLTVNPNPVVAGSAQQFSFTGYWNLEVAGHEGTLFHRMSTASLDNFTFGLSNPFGNR